MTQEAFPVKIFGILYFHIVVFVVSKHETEIRIYKRMYTKHVVKFAAQPVLNLYNISETYDGKYVIFDIPFSLMGIFTRLPGPHWGPTGPMDS